MTQQAVAEIVIVIELEVGGKSVGRVPLQRHATNEILQSLSGIGKDGRGARLQFDISADVLILGRDANAERVADRTGNIAADGIAFLLEFVGCLAAHFPLLGRVGGAHREDTGRGAFSEEQGLRPLEHVDLRHVEEGRLDQSHGADRHAVKIKGHGRVKGSGNIGGADAAQADLAAGTGAADLDIERRNAADDVGDFVDLIIVQRLGADRGHGDRRFLQRFILLARVDDDHPAVIYFGIFLRAGGCCETGKGEAGRGAHQEPFHGSDGRRGFVALRLLFHKSLPVCSPFHWSEASRCAGCSGIIGSTEWRERPECSTGQKVKKGRDSEKSLQEGLVAREPVRPAVSSCCRDSPVASP